MNDKTKSLAQEEFGHAKLGDARRTARAALVFEGALRQPAGTIEAVFDNLAELHGAYDFVENEHINPDDLFDAVANATARRAKKLSFVWIPTDGTSATITDRTRSKETGRVGSSRSNARGDIIHLAYALDPDGVPLGPVSLEAWQRGPKSTRPERDKRKTEEKETQAWLNARENGRALWLVLCPGVVRHYLHDRGADAWPVVADMALPQEGEYTTIRAAWDRRLWDPEPSDDAQTRYLRDALAETTLEGECELDVPASRTRTARCATMQLRACAVTLSLRDKWNNKRTPAEVFVVCAREVSAVPAGEDPLEWMLLTSYPIHTLEDAKFVLGGYAWRWRIEQLFAAWKTAGTDIEASQLGAADHRARWRIILLATASTLLRWQILATTRPDTPAEQEFSAEVLEAVRDVQKDEVVPAQGATVWQVAVALGYLGGWPGSNTRPPGIKVLCRGWRRVMDYLVGKRRVAARNAQNLLPGAPA